MYTYPLKDIKEDFNGNELTSVLEAGISHLIAYLLVYSVTYLT
jgi:hypothetical protein